MLSEKAKSRAQQRFFGMVRAAQKGEMENPSAEVLDAADSMKVSDVKKFAKTKHKGLPEKKEVKEGTSIIQGRSSGKKVGYRGPTGDHKRDKHGHIVASHYKSNKTASKVTTVKKKSSTQKSPGFTPKTGEERKDTLRRFNNYEKLKKQIHARDDARKKANQEQPKKPKGKLRQKGDTWRADWSTHKHYKPPTKKKKLEEVAFLAGLAKGAAVAAKGAVKGAVKQKAKQVVQQKAAQVASGAIPQPNMSESKGTAELAAIKLRGKKACAVCGSLTHATGQCPKKEHDVNEGVGRMIGTVAGTVAKAAKAVNREVLPIKHAKNLEKEVKRGYEESKPKEVKKKINKKRNILQKGIGKVARAVSSKTDKIASTMGEAKVDKGRSDYGKATIRNWRHSGPDTVEPAMFDPENKRGKTIDKRREEHKARRGKKGAKVPVYTKEDNVPAKVPLKKTGNWLQNRWNEFVPPPESSNSPCVRSGKCTPGKLETPGLKLMNNTAKKINKPIKTVSKVAKSARSVASAVAPVAAGLAVSKGVDSLMKMGKKKKIKEQILDELNLDELKLFGKKGEAIFYNDPKGRRETLQTTGKDPGAVNKPAVNNAVKKVKSTVTNKVNQVGSTVQKSIDTQTNRAGSNIGNQISRKVQPAVSSGVADGIKQGATAVGKAALKGAAAVGGGLAVSKGVDSVMKGGKKKTNEELSIVDKMIIEYSPKVVLEKKKQPSVHDDYYDPMEDPYFDPHEAEATRGQSGKGTKGKMNVRKKYPVKEGVVDVIKKGTKRHKDAVEKKKIKNRKAVPYAALGAGYELEGDTIEEGKGKAAVTGALGNIAGRTIGRAVAGPAGAVVGKYAGAALGAAAGAKKGRRKSAAVGGALGTVLPGAGLGLGSGAGAALAASHEPEGELVDETYFDTNRRGISTKGGFVKQYNKPGKLSRASLNHERKSKDPELRMSKKELRKSMEDDANYEKKMGRSKPTPSNLKTALKKMKEDYYRGTGEKVQARTKKWMDKKGQKGAPGLDAMKARTAEHKAKRGVKEAYRVLASSDGQEKPSQFSYKDEKTAKKYADSIKKGGGKATVVKEDIGSFRDYMANVQAAKKRQQDKQDNRKKKDDAYIERVRKGIKFYDAKGSGRVVKGRKVYDKK